MAHKSKTQRAKASASRQARKEQKAIDEANAALAEAEAPIEEPKKGLSKLFNKSNKEEKPQQQNAQQATAPAKKEEKPKKKSRFAFLKEVKAELKRVTWPSRQDVTRWSLVVVAALVFFGLYVALLDNVIITPVLVAISGLGA